MGDRQVKQAEVMTDGGDGALVFEIGWLKRRKRRKWGVKIDLATSRAPK